MPDRSKKENIADPTQRLAKEVPPLSSKYIVSAQLTADRIDWLRQQSKRVADIHRQKFSRTTVVEDDR